MVNTFRKAIGPGLVTQALQQGGSAPPDVTAAAERARTSLIMWIGVSSRAEANRVDVRMRQRRRPSRTS